eukprot:scaffold15462_cov146-Skeletonema_marinoi.AAC.1
MPLSSLLPPASLVDATSYNTEGSNILDKKSRSLACTSLRGPLNRLVRESVSPQRAKRQDHFVASSGHLRRYSVADMTNKCLSRAKDASILAWPTLMGH